MSKFMTTETIFLVNHNTHDNSQTKNVNNKLCGCRLMENVPDIENNPEISERHHQIV
jgi:hypothetical protein